MDIDKITEVATSLADDTDADILFYFIYLSNSLKEKSNEGNNKENDPEGSEASGEAISRAEVSRRETESEAQDGKLRAILSKRKTKS